MDYPKRLRILREKKLEETRIKAKLKCYQDGDDYGSVPPDEEYRFVCIPTMRTVHGMAMKAAKRN